MRVAYTPWSVKTYSLEVAGARRPELVAQSLGTAENLIDDT